MFNFNLKNGKNKLLGENFSFQPALEMSRDTKSKICLQFHFFSNVFVLGHLFSGTKSHIFLCHTEEQLPLWRRPTSASGMKWRSIHHLDCSCVQLKKFDLFLLAAYSTDHFSILSIVFSVICIPLRWSRRHQGLRLRWPAVWLLPSNIPFYCALQTEGCVHLVLKITKSLRLCVSSALQLTQPAHLLIVELKQSLL